MKRFCLWLLFMGEVFHLSAQKGTDYSGRLGAPQPPASYNNINQKSWIDILTDNQFRWRPPYTVHLPIQPAHSSDWVHVSPSLFVTRLHVTDKVTTRDARARQAALSEETWLMQFAFDKPAFLPDFRLSSLSLTENKYPVVTGDYYANDLYYKISYAVSRIDEKQSLLNATISVKNEDVEPQQAEVRVKIGFHPGNKLFNYHYIPFYWDVSKWLPYHEISLEQNNIFNKGLIVGKIHPGSMLLSWEKENSFSDEDYEKRARVTRASGYVLPNFRLHHLQDCILAQAYLDPGETKEFSVSLLVNTDRINEYHLSYLKEATPEQIRQQSLEDFKNLFSERNTRLSFPTEQWDDIFSELQLSTLQLLVDQGNPEMFMPTQGGSSERFFVWVWEAVEMLRPMLRTGQFEPVKKALQFIFSLQNAGVPPEGRFTTTQGAVGTTGPRWANTTGAALALACDYYLYSKDESFLNQYLPKILEAMNWIAGEISATRKLNPDGTRPITYGLMPFAVATDGDIGYIVSFTDSYTFWGFSKAVSLLQRIGHRDTGKFQKELALYQQDILTTVEKLSHPGGFIDRKILTDDRDTRITSKFENTVSMASIAYTGIMDPQSELFQRFVHFYEDSLADGYFMGKMDREIVYIGNPEHVWQDIYLETAQWKKAFAATQVNLKYGITHDTYQTQERFSKRDPAFTAWQPNGSGNGRMLDMMLNSLYFENNEEEVTLCGAMPFEWLRKNEKTLLNNLYTLNGKVNLDIQLTDSKSCLITLSALDPKALPRKIRFPESLHAVALSRSVKKEGNGMFTLMKPLNTIKFKISDNSDF